MFILDGIREISMPGTGKVNEDKANHEGNLFWIMDGATGLGENIISDKTDAYWFTRWWDMYLKEQSYSCRSLEDIVSAGIEKIKKEYSKYVSEMDKFSHPTASISLLRFDEKSGEMEYFTLGDTRIYTSVEDNRLISDESVTKLDNIIFEEMKKTDGFGKRSLEDINNELRPLKIKNRSLNNTSEGYWILGFDKEAVKHAKKGKFKVRKGDKILMATDGYYALSDKYNLVNESSLLEKTFENGVSDMMYTLRRFENDEEAVRYIPRFKKMDDATCTLMCVNELNSCY